MTNSIRKPFIAALTALSLCLWAGTGARAAVLFDHTFDQSAAGGLDGTAVGGSAETFSATAATLASGVYSSSAQSAAFVNFSPTLGETYLLSIWFSVTSASDTSDWLGVGFSPTNDTDPAGGSFPDKVWNDNGDNVLDPWSLTRANGGTGVVVDQPGATHTFGAGFMSIEIDATLAGATWVGNTNYVGFGNWNSAEGAVNRFRLETLTASVPEPATLAMLALGLAGIARRRRQTA